MTNVKRMRIPSTGRGRSRAAGEPADIMYQNVMRLLVRAYGIHKLELDVEAVLDPCLPDIFNKSQAPASQWENLEACLNYDEHVQFIVWTGTGDTPFWMKSKQLVLTPVRRDAGLRVQSSHPHYSEIHKWLDASTTLDTRLTDAKLYMHRTFDRLKHPKWVEAHWPEIMPYIGKIPEVLTQGMKEPRPSTLTFDDELAEWINTTLTACALLPADYNCQAWPGLWHERNRV